MNSMKKGLQKMGTFFKKDVGQPTQQFFKKSSSTAQKFFKKGGEGEKIVGRVAGGIQNVSDKISQGVTVGDNLLKGISNSPYGQSLAPLLGAGRMALSTLGSVSKISSLGSGAIKNLASGKGVKQITHDTLEAAKKVQNEGKSIQYA